MNYIFFFFFTFPKVPSILLLIILWDKYQGG